MIDDDDDGEYYREATHERLLTREQIDMLENLDDLIAIQDEVTATAKRIEVDLEFRSDDRADEDWEHRARGALTAHYVCNGHITRRINYLRRGGKAPKQNDAGEKARRKEAQAALVAAAADNKRAKLAHQRETTNRMMLDTLARQSLLLHFHKICANELGKDEMRRLMGLANTSLQAAVKAEIDASRIEARSDETPQEVRPEGQEPDPKGDAQPLYL